MNEMSLFSLLALPDIATVLAALEAVPTVELTATNESGQSPLHLAVKENQLAVASVLLARGFSPNQQDNTQLSPFIMAAANGFDDMLKLLLTAAPELTQVNRFGGTALLPASEKGYLPVVEVALAAGVPVNHANRLGWSALLEAVILGDGGFLFRDIVAALLSAGADPELKDFTGKSAATYASEKGHTLIVSLLQPSAAPETFATIRQLIQQGSYFQALQQLQQVEECPEQVYYLAYSYERLGLLASATYYYQRGLTMSPEFAYYLANLAKKQGLVAEALDFFDLGTMKSQGDPFFAYHKSNYLRELGRHQEAIAVMDALLADAPARVDYLFHKANSLRSLGQHQAAYEQMQLALSYQPATVLFQEHAQESLAALQA